MRKCYQTKSTWKNELDAKLVLIRWALVGQETDNDYLPREVYWCKDCDGYHLTSRPLNGKRMRSQWIQTY